MSKSNSKITFFILMITVATSYSNRACAQRLVFLAAHGVFSSPQGTDFKNGYGFGLGGELEVGVSLLSKTFITGTVGVSEFIHASQSGTPNFSYVPVKAGVRHYLVARILFVNADLGAGFINASGTNGFSATRFTADIGAGVKLAAFEIAADFDGFTHPDPSGFNSWIALKAGFNFGL